jgi:hypothetical protein
MLTFNTFKASQSTASKTLATLFYTSICQVSFEMATIVMASVAVNAQVVDVSFDDKLRNARKVLVSVLTSKKHMMDTDERMEFLYVDEGLYALINGMPNRITQEDTLAGARKLLKRYGKVGVL